MLVEAGLLVESFQKLLRSLDSCSVWFFASVKDGNRQVSKFSEGSFA